MATLAPLPREDASFADQALGRLREEIVSGELAPGARVHLSEAAERLGMSIVPVREALRSLVAEGLVLSLPQRGYRVAPTSNEDLSDVYRLRLVLDPMATALAVPRLTGADRRDLTGAMTALERAYATGDRALHRDAHRRFHFGIYDACGSPWLIRFLDLLWVASYRYQRLSAPRRGTLTDRGAEHRRILDACLEGDGELAALLMRKHLELTLAAAGTELVA
jgi:DNA-binding GntR family transcriptional regulator